MTTRSLFTRPALANRWLIPAGLLILCALSFGSLIFSLGLYWDDWPSLWFLHFFGPRVFPLAFAADRPVQGWLFVLTTSLVGESLLAWQIFGILTRWLSGLALGWMLVSVWPQRKPQVLWVTVLFLLYPGFMQQYIPITYGHQFLILSLFFFSMGLMVWSVRKPELYWLLTFASLLSALLTMFALEYFYGLELLRPVFLWLALGNVGQVVGQAASLTARQRLWLTLRRWLPYFILDAFFLAWRLTHSTPRGEVTLFKNLSLAPAATLAELVRTILIRSLRIGAGRLGANFYLSKFWRSEAEPGAGLRRCRHPGCLAGLRAAQARSGCAGGRCACRRLTQADALGSAGAAGRPLRPVDCRLAGVGDRFASGVEAYPGTALPSR